MKKIKGQIFTEKNRFEAGELTIEGNTICEVKKCDISELSGDEKQQRIIPGLIDIHMHGAAGFDVCRCDENGIKKIAEYEKQHGVTTICVATMTLAQDTLQEICKRCYTVIEAGANSDMSGIEGIYLEGPFIASEKAGAQNPEFVVRPNMELWNKMQNAAGEMIKVVTVAPEVEGAIEFIKQLTAEQDRASDITKGCKISIAHTMATAKQTKDAFEAGASQVTHLYNAMTGVSHREPGVPGEAADHDDVMVELICDGIHVDPVMIRNTFRMFGSNRIIFISDSSEATGMPDGEYMLGDQHVIKNGNKVTLYDGTIAGSVSNLYDCMVNAISFGIKPEEAIMAATVNPAKQIGILDKTGSIEKGKKSDLLIIDDNYNLIKVITGEGDI